MKLNLKTSAGQRFGSAQHVARPILSQARHPWRQATVDTWTRSSLAPSISCASTPTSQSAPVGQQPAEALEETASSSDRSSTPDSPPASTHPAPQKGEFVRGLVRSVDLKGATILLDSGYTAELSWRNLTKLKALAGAETEPSLALDIGERVWGCVLFSSADGKVALSTAALEVRPGDMVRRKKHVFVGMDQWAARGGSMPLQEWRGRIELEQFLAGSTPGAAVAKWTAAEKAAGEAAAAAAAARPPPVSSAGSPKAWGLDPEPSLGRGDIVLGTVSAVKTYGVFVRLDRERDGLIPMGLISKTYTDEEAVMAAFKPGDKVLALIHRLGDEEGDSRAEADADEGGGRETNSNGWRRPEAAGAEKVGNSGGRARSGSGSGQGAAGAAAGGSGAASPPKSRMRFILSTRALEAEEGLIKRDLDEYNSRALMQFQQFQSKGVQNHLDMSKSSREQFGLCKEAWQRGGIQLPQGVIVKCLVMQMQTLAAFVKLSFGPSAKIHFEDISNVRFKKMSNVLSVGETIYGRVYSYPTNTIEANKAEASNPMQFWMSIKQLEPVNNPGAAVNQREKFWGDVRAEYDRQGAQPTPKEGQASLTMYKSDLDLNPLIEAIKRLEYIPWHVLAGRPEPGLRIETPLPADMGGLTPVMGGDLPASFEAERLSVQSELLRVLPAALAPLLLQTGGAQEQEQPPTAATASSAESGAAESGAAEAQQPEPAWMAGLCPEAHIPEVSRHAWVSLRVAAKQAVARLVGLRVKAAAASLWRAQQPQPQAGDAAPEGEEEDQLDACYAELAAAAAAAVAVARMMPEASGRDLVLDMFTLTQTLGVPLPLAAVDSLMLWGWALTGAGDTIGSEPLQSSMLLEVLAACGQRPPEAWCASVFKLLYVDMVTYGDPRQTLHYFKLMHALGYVQRDFAWWDRFLQQLNYNEGRTHKGGNKGMLAHEVEQLRQVVAGVSALK